ncbi:hypothetical protein M3Y97_00223800 [Aphelenchoides bicaudatus]|nr:hypothetical protein M3Y97_00223800 [Aphelenchoides bicaudatus]
MTILLKFGIYSIFSIYTFIAIAFFIFGFASFLCWIAGLSLLLLALFAFLYLHGLNIENNWLMLPFLVSEIIVRLILGGFVFVCWICYVMSLFDQIGFESPIGVMTLDQFFLFLSVVTTSSFAFLIYIYFPLYGEYRTIKKLNDRRRMERYDDESQQYISLNFTSRPTKL